MRKLLHSIKEFYLNTPRKYQVIIKGYHFHKSFWGCLLVMLGLLLFPTDSKKTSTFSIALGSLLIFLSVKGHRYTNNRPLFKLWDREKR